MINFLPLTNATLDLIFSLENLNHYLNTDTDDAIADVLSMSATNDAINDVVSMIG